MAARESCAVEVCAHTAVPASAIWAELADGAGWHRWVAGTRKIRFVDPDWPSPGSALHHCWGRCPLCIRDYSTVLACEPSRRLELTARVAPLAVVKVSITLDVAVAGGTRVRLRETITGGAARLVPPLTRRIQRWRNRRSLDALLEIAGGTAAT